MVRGDNLKDELILLRCDKEEKQQIKRDAEEHGKCICQYIRYLVAKERKEMEESERKIERIRNMPKRETISQKEMEKYRTP